MVTEEYTDVETEVAQQIARQQNKGIKKYGHSIDHCQRKSSGVGYNWTQESIEECVDMLQYLCAAKLKIRDDRNKLMEALRLLTKVQTWDNDDEELQYKAMDMIAEVVSEM